ncbi:MAG: lipocalin family protein [Bacteroidales bacterium]
MKIHFAHSIMVTVIIWGMSSCSSIPQGAVAVQDFDKSQYLGTWYEIARLDFKYERNLNNTTATYTLNENGTINVINRGFNVVTQEWKEATGTAKFVKADTIGMLKVSFFKPFYSGYNVIAIDKDYTYALVAGKNLDYLWILSRTTSIPNEIRKNYLAIAQKIGYKTENLIWVKHSEK